MIEWLIHHADPLNAALLVLIWWRLEKSLQRINRLENEIIEDAIERKTITRREKETDQ